MNATSMAQLLASIGTDIRRADMTLSALDKQWEKLPKAAIDLLTKCQNDMRHWQVRRLTLIEIWERAARRAWRSAAPK